MPTKGSTSSKSSKKRTTTVVKKMPKTGKNMSSKTGEKQGDSSSGNTEDVKKVSRKKTLTSLANSVETKSRDFKEESDEHVSDIDPPSARSDSSTGSEDSSESELEVEINGLKVVDEHPVNSRKIVKKKK